MSDEDFAEIPVLFCADCAVVIANGDSSGIPGDRVENHLAAMQRELGGQVAVVGEEADIGFSENRCGGCGEDIATDRWFTGWVESAS